jgi:surfeit locus 1 family protein
MILLRPFSRRWFFATLLVLAGTAVLVRLGIWQLDQLAQRREFNVYVITQVSMPSFELDDTAMESALTLMEYRAVHVVGVYDFSQQVVLRNQVYQDKIGVNILTPLRIAGSNRAVMVNRGWIPIEDYLAGDLHPFDELGTVMVSGVIRLSQEKPDFGKISDPTPAPGAGRLEAWNLANIPRMDEQISYKLLPVYIQQSPEPAWTALPYRTTPNLELTEGPHQSYAIQWFSFAAVLFFGYPFFIRREEKRLSEGKLIHPSTQDRGERHV